MYIYVMGEAIFYFNIKYKKLLNFDFYSSLVIISDYKSIKYLLRVSHQSSLYCYNILLSCIL